MKKIGIVNFYKNDFPINLIKVLAELNDNVFLISCKDDYIEMIKWDINYPHVNQKRCICSYYF